MAILGDRTIRRLEAATRRSERAPVERGEALRQHAQFVVGTTVLAKLLSVGTVAGTFNGRIWRRDETGGIGAFKQDINPDYCIVYATGAVGDIVLCRVVYIDPVTKVLELFALKPGVAARKPAIFGEITGRATVTGQTTRYSYTEKAVDASGATVSVAGGESSTITSGAIATGYVQDIGGMADNGLIGFRCVMVDNPTVPGTRTMGKWIKWTERRVTGTGTGTGTGELVCNDPPPGGTVSVDLDLTVGYTEVVHFYIGGS